jgi:hypothetical protein
MKISRRGSVVFLEGVVDENADFSPLLSESPPLQLNLSGISRINSIGVRSWMKFISLWGDKPMEYLECPTIITDQISITPVLMGLKKPVVKIMSGFISYVCSKCNQQEDLRVSRAHVITRAEFTGRRFTYAVEVDTSEGFELCPADVCAIGELACPVGEVSGKPVHKFTIVEGIDARLRSQLEAFLERAGVDVAGIEFIIGEDGQPLVYDVNTNTNYNPEAEARAGIAGTSRSGMGALAAYLGRLLAEPRSRAA